MPDESLIIFLKAPRPGFVKTRLARTSGVEPACAAYRRLVETLLANLTALTGVELRYSPDEAAGEIQPWLRPHWHSRAQGEGDLGARLHRAFAESFLQDAQRVVIIGSDCPEVTPRDIAEAWRALQSHDLVLGPATDGGYWLIGLNHVQPSLFTEMVWSTETVLQETLQRARSAALRVSLLRELVDVDTEVEWKDFLARSAGKT